MLIPNIANIVKGMIERRPFAAGTAIGQAVGAPGTSLYRAASGFGPIRAIRQEGSEDFGADLAGKAAVRARYYGLPGVSTRLKKVEKRLRRE